MMQVILVYIAVDSNNHPVGDVSSVRLVVVVPGLLVVLIVEAQSVVVQGVQPVEPVAVLELVEFVQAEQSVVLVVVLVVFVLVVLHESVVMHSVQVKSLPLLMMLVPLELLELILLV